LKGITDLGMWCKGVWDKKKKYEKQREGGEGCRKHAPYELPIDEKTDARLEGLGAQEGSPSDLSKKPGGRGRTVQCLKTLRIYNLAETSKAFIERAGGEKRRQPVLREL